MPDDPLFDYEAALAACARGERQGLQGLYLQESRRLLGVALRIVRERALAEDVLHDAFVKIWNRAAWRLMRPLLSLKCLIGASPLAALPLASHSIGSCAGFSGEMQKASGLSPSRAMPTAGWMR